MRPSVLVNVAASADGKIDTVARHGAPISSDADWERVQRLRASVDAVMVGPRTLLDEDPRLTVRSAPLRAGRVARGAPEQPAKVSIVRAVGDLRWESRFLSEGPARVILFSAEPSLAITGSRRSGVEVYCVPSGTEPGRVDLTRAMEALGSLGIKTLLVEGGGGLIFELFRLGLVDELQVYVAPIVLGGATAPTLADGAGLPREAAVRLGTPDVEAYPDGGILLRYKVKLS